MGSLETLLKGAIAKATAAKKGGGNIFLDAHHFETEDSQVLDPFAPLSSLYNMKTISKQLKAIRNEFHVAEKEGAA